MSSFLYVMEKFSLDRERALSCRGRVSEKLIILYSDTLSEILICCAELERKVNRLELERLKTDVKPEEAKPDSNKPPKKREKPPEADPSNFNIRW